MLAMQLEWLFGPKRRVLPAEEFLLAGPQRVRLEFVRNRRARRYILRLRPNGIARVTVPRGGTLTEAKSFAERNTAWLERQLLRQAALPRRPAHWSIGMEILFRGEQVRIEPGDPGFIRLGSETLPVPGTTGDLRPALERHLSQLADRELPVRVFELAAQHQFQVRRVSVRNQRSRWGSCSRHGDISLNWRLIQAPASVRDYIILHELAHLRHMNHSRRFWAEVARLCPEFPAAERWLKMHSGLLSPT